MPPPAIKTLRDLLYWQYAKIIAASAGIAKRQWAFVMDRFRKLRSGEIRWDTIREYVKEREDPDHCVYCGRSGPLTLEHLIPREHSGPEDEKNVVWVCAPCNAAKGSRRLYEHWTVRGGLQAAKYEVPRLAEGKYLKLLHDLFAEASALDTDERRLREAFCPVCDLRRLCEAEDSAGKLSPLCLDGVATLLLRRTGSG